MSIRGNCSCKNIQITWQLVDHSLVPRACQCDYCLSKSAAYVSKSGSRFEVHINNHKLHKIIQHGSNSADFHECGNCGQVVFVTVEIDDELYGALNANLLHNKFGFSEAVKANFSNQSAEQKIQRWCQNWSIAVILNK